VTIQDKSKQSLIYTEIVHRQLMQVRNHQVIVICGFLDAAQKAPLPNLLLFFEWSLQIDL